nr:hypothetical protein [Caproicibacter fermentans]
MGGIAVDAQAQQLNVSLLELRKSLCEGDKFRCANRREVAGK